MSRHPLATGQFSHFSVRGLDFNRLSSKELRALYFEVLKEGVHGLCFSAYEEGQEPGDMLSYEQVHRRMGVMAPYTEWTRVFSCVEGNEHIPVAAKAHGIKTMVGAWIEGDHEKNQVELEALVHLINDGKVDIAAVGNEVLLRGELSEDDILEYIQFVKDATDHRVPVGYVDAYYEFTLHPRIAAACDVVLINCYPFWEGCPIDYALPYMQSMYQEAVRAAKGKKVIISETGWPSQGTNFEASYPSEENFYKYFINTQLWARRDDIDVLYFTSFDESWKVGDEGDVGAYWGIWDKKEQLKFA